jgi:hypothetical protein
MSFIWRKSIMGYLNALFAIHLFAGVYVFYLISRHLLLTSGLYTPKSLRRTKRFLDIP